MGTKIFVGNLSFDTTERDLEDLFMDVGDIIEVFMPADKFTGRPRGFAFVEFREEESVQQAVEKFNNHDLNGRNIGVKEAEERPAPGPGGGGGPKFGGKKGGGGFKKSRPKGSRKGLRNKKRF